MISSTQKKIWFSMLIALAIILSGYGVFIFKETQEHKHAAAKIAEYCQNPKVELATSEYSIEKGMFPRLQTEIKTKKFDDIYVYVTARYHDENIEEGVKENVNELCATSTSKMPKRTFLFWYQLNDEYSVMGQTKNKVPTGMADRAVGNFVDFVVIKNDTKTVVYGFNFTAYMEEPENYKRLSKSTMKDIIAIIVRDNAPGVLEAQEPEKITSIDTSDWQTYRNEKYGFTIKLPGDIDKYILSVDEVNRSKKNKIEGSPIAALDIQYALDNKVLRAPSQPELGYLENLTVWYISIVQRDEYKKDFCEINRLPNCRQGDILGENDKYIFLSGFINVEGAGYLCAEQPENQANFCRVNNFFSKEDIGQLINFTAL